MIHISKHSPILAQNMKNLSKKLPLSAFESFLISIFDLTQQPELKHAE